MKTQYLQKQLNKKSTFSQQKPLLVGSNPTP